MLATIGLATTIVLCCAGPAPLAGGAVSGHGGAAVIVASAGYAIARPVHGRGGGDGEDCCPPQRTEKRRAQMTESLDAMVIETGGAQLSPVTVPLSNVPMRSPSRTAVIRSTSQCSAKDFQVLISCDLDGTKTWKPSVVSKRVRTDPPNQLKRLAGLDDDVVTAGGVVEVDDARDVERCAL
jgi:hypothetical protein